MLHAGIAYLDPGNLESQLQAGAQAGYDLMWVLLWVVVMVRSCFPTWLVMLPEELLQLLMTPCKACIPDYAPHFAHACPVYTMLII